MAELVILVIALIGGWHSRMCGGAPPKLPWGIDQWIYALPYLVITLPTGLLGSAASYVSAIAGKRTGHGNGHDAGTAERGSDEQLEFLIKWLHGRIPEYWYDMLLLAVVGFAVTLVPGVCLSFHHPFAGLALALSGLTKAPAYMIGWTIYPRGSGRGLRHLDHATAVGEFFTGFFGWGSVAVIAYEFKLVEVFTW